MTITAITVLVIDVVIVSTIVINFIIIIISVSIIIATTIIIVASIVCFIFTSAYHFENWPFRSLAVTTSLLHVWGVRVPF